MGQLPEDDVNSVLINMGQPRPGWGSPRHSVKLSLSSLSYSSYAGVCEHRAAAGG